MKNEIVELTFLRILMSLLLYDSIRGMCSSHNVLTAHSVHPSESVAPGSVEAPTGIKSSSKLGAVASAMNK